jgi:mitochondrial import inner membrane translocase subunit TIM21
MHFNVAGAKGEGVVHLHMTKRPGQSEYDYNYLYLDVKGQQRIFLEGSDGSDAVKNNKKFLGVRWGW